MSVYQVIFSLVWTASLKMSNDGESTKTSCHSSQSMHICKITHVCKAKQTGVESTEAAALFNRMASMWSTDKSVPISCKSLPHCSYLFMWPWGSPRIRWARNVSAVLTPCLSLTKYSTGLLATGAESSQILVFGQFGLLFVVYLCLEG